MTEPDLPEVVTHRPNGVAVTIHADGRRVVPHQPADECGGDHCYAHNVDEPAANAHTVCGECFHVFPTARALRRDHRRVLWQMRPLRGPLPWHSTPWQQSLWRYLYRLATVRTSQIWVCPHCAHDL